MSLSHVRNGKTLPPQRRKSGSENLQAKRAGIENNAYLIAGAVRENTHESTTGTKKK